MGDVRASRSLFAPWITGRVFASSGWARLQDRELPEGWTGDTDAGIKSSVGVGLGLGWDILHLDLGHGLGAGGGWGFSVSATKRFRGWL